MTVGQIERKTQDRVVELFQDTLHYTYLGNWEERENRNIEKELLEKYLKDKYDDSLIQKAIAELEKVTTNQTKSLYDLNKDVYNYLRYGIAVKENVGDKNQTIELINWDKAEKNDFYIAEEVTVVGEHEKRPDIVLYVNGIALGVIELKRSTKSVLNGIRQNLDNQKPEFIKQFFATIQLVMAGNDTEGLRYGVIETPEKYYLTWKEDCGIRIPLDNHLVAMCNKERLIELIHDFIIFDAGIKKIARHSQYFGVKATQLRLKKREGGIIWHSQGSGKTLIMVWISKWIRENVPDSRVLIITDREELDGQIENRFYGVDEEIYRTKSGDDLVKQLNDTKPWLMCSLIHKFRKGAKSDYDEDFDEIISSLPSDFKAKGDIYVMVDECHRTQSGKHHDAMKKIIPNAIFVGFTGTPLLKKDKKKSLEIFGGYIDTYKYDEAVRDKVILDLRFEARKIDQKLTSKDRVDQWFDAKTEGLTAYARTELKKKWATMQKVLSSNSRLEKITNDIHMDMETVPRLKSGLGNAILIAGSISEACKYWELFQKSGLKKCAIITSYNSHISSIKGETVSLDEDTQAILKNETYQKMLNGKNIEDFEREVKDKFVKQPAQMKLLIVVDKLLTGFDAPPATYLYIDKSMKDHGLFQAICRVNRLDGEDKEFGQIIDYKDLFKSIDKSITDYTSDALDGFDDEDISGLVTDRLEKAKKRLNETLDSVSLLCEPVKPPKDTQDFIDYFAPEELDETAPRREALYKMSASLIRAYSTLANDMPEAGYSKKDAHNLKEKARYFTKVRDEIKLASGDHIDLKAYEPSMRYMIDTYISADESEKISSFEDLTLVEMIVQNGIEGTIGKMPKNIRKNKGTSSEIIENNIRKLITEEKPTNPKFFDRMSILLREIIKQRKEDVISYEEYLKQISDFCNKVKGQSSDIKLPESLNTKTKRVLYENLDNNESLALAVDEAILSKKPDGWRGNKIKERKIFLAIKEALNNNNIDDDEQVKTILELARRQNDY
jgi:type I restriction enzyme, R subunit